MRDAAEFDAFYLATSRRVVGHVYVMTGDLAAAEDAVAEAYLKAWSRWRAVRRADSPEAWVRRVASRQAISTWRKVGNGRRAAERVAADAARLPPATVGPDHVALVAALQRISAHQRRAIVLHHLVGLGVAEIATETGAPTGTVKARLSRGRAALAAILADEPGATTRPSSVGPGRATRSQENLA
ncbi:SigE family RNA polymerase sigma factor [Nocardioides lentus]|uniref:SigE family RNA polymerase sigma factor n=1 Tax=Nocardioides lentus TaxID=338077 RepID=A0ABP5ASJ0_9ACTN